MFLAPSCCGCGRGGVVVCDDCRATLRCAPPLPAPAGVDVALALVSYEGVAAAAVQGAKFRHQRDALTLFADALGRLVAEVLPGEDASGTDVAVTWVPALPANRRRRGFDQGELIASRVAAAVGVRHTRLLRRTDRYSQTGLDRATRLAGPSFATCARVPCRVVLVDDVRTTGASLGRAAGALRRGGAQRVVAATLAATPDPIPSVGRLPSVHNPDAHGT